VERLEALILRRLAAFDEEQRRETTERRQALGGALTAARLLLRSRELREEMWEARAVVDRNGGQLRDGVLRGAEASRRSSPRLLKPSARKRHS
jgi:hypothetical protein